MWRLFAWPMPVSAGTALDHTIRSTAVRSVLRLNVLKRRGELMSWPTSHGTSARLLSKARTALTSYLSSAPRMQQQLGDASASGSAFAGSLAFAIPAGAVTWTEALKISICVSHSRAQSKSVRLPDMGGVSAFRAAAALNRSIISVQGKARE